MPSKGSGPYANRIYEAFRIDLFINLCFCGRQQNRPILGVLTKHYISEAFRIDVVNKSMFLRSTTTPQVVSIRGRFDQTFYFLRGE